MERNEQFEPKIVAFCCNWCSYAGADLAGGMRLKYSANLIPIRVMCSARVSPHFIIRAFQEGADGVLVAGCHIGDCHYLKGNYIAIKRVAIMRELIDFIGIPQDRLRLEWIAGSEGDKYARVADEFAEQIRRLGPSPIKNIPFRNDAQVLNRLIGEEVKR